MKTLYELAPNDANLPSTTPAVYSPLNSSGTLDFLGTATRIAWWSGLPIPYGFGEVDHVGLSVHWFAASGIGDVVWDGMLQSEQEGDVLPANNSTVVQIIAETRGTDQPIVTSLIEFTDYVLVPGRLFQIRLRRLGAATDDTLNSIVAHVTSAALVVF
jgi:hypothetical protein